KGAKRAKWPEQCPKGAGCGRGFWPVSSIFDRQRSKVLFGQGLFSVALMLRNVFPFVLSLSKRLYIQGCNAV
ncbi:MAG: hypothetical protein Q8M93_02940, partial [Polaromonas sp.]|uniref:hypothetical protein n=1 Tax=Polaromonas sp. TaxID=1869339 RepID=UPI0027320585